MTATKPAPAPSSYVSGFCSRARHEYCRGTYPGAVCDCACHSAEPEPELLEPAPPPVPTPVAHCPTCHCGEPR